MAGEIVWVIDDEGAVRNMLDTAFSRFAKYDTRVFPTASEALDVLANGGQKPDAILCDFFGAPSGKWEGMHIDAFYTQAAHYLEGTHRYGMTGSSDKQVAEEFGDISGLELRQVFRKPLPPLPEVIKTVQQGFAEKHADGCEPRAAD